VRGRGAPENADTTAVDRLAARARGRSGPTTPRAAPRSRPPAAAGDTVAVLADALRDGRRVWVEMVGRTGAMERRELKPLRLDGGRLRALDPDREAELTIAVHRIAAVEPAD
jgi:hypothetical protein